MKKFFGLAFAGEQFGNRTMIGSRITARAEFQGLHPEGHEVIQHQVQFHRPQYDCENTDFHNRSLDARILPSRLKWTQSELLVGVAKVSSQLKMV